MTARGHTTRTRSKNAGVGRPFKPRGKPRHPPHARRSAPKKHLTTTKKHLGALPAADLRHKLGAPQNKLRRGQHWTVWFQPPPPRPPSSLPPHLPTGGAPAPWFNKGKEWLRPFRSGLRRPARWWYSRGRRRPAAPTPRPCDLMPTPTPLDGIFYDELLLRASAAADGRGSEGGGDRAASLDDLSWLDVYGSHFADDALSSGFLTPPPREPRSPRPVKA